MSLLIPEIIMLGTRLMNANCSYQYGSNNSFNKILHNFEICFL